MASRFAVSLNVLLVLNLLCCSTGYLNQSNIFRPRETEYRLVGVAHNKQGVCMVTRHSATACTHGGNVYAPTPKQLRGKTPSSLSSSRMEVVTLLNNTATILQLVQRDDDQQRRAAFASENEDLSLLSSSPHGWNDVIEEVSLSARKYMASKLGFDSIGKVNAKSVEILWTSESKDYLPSGTKALKPPFWLPCNTDSLVDVTKNIFG